MYAVYNYYKIEHGKSLSELALHLLILHWNPKNSLSVQMLCLPGLRRSVIELFERVAEL